MQRLLFFLQITLLTACCVSTGCTKEAKKSRLLSRAESDFKSGAYDKAKVEYLNVLRLDQQNATAFARLGEIWSDEGAPLRAGAFLVRAKELAPNDLANRLRLARIYNTVGNRPEAREEVAYILQHAPNNGEALILLTEMAFTPEEISSAEQAVAAFPEKQSVAHDLAAANLAMRKSDLSAAQPLVNRALATDPKSALAHRSKAVLHLLQKNPEGALAEFKASADLAPPRSGMKITYADFLARTGKTAEATSYLKGLASKTPDFLPAWTILARTALAEKKYDETLTLLENVFSRDPESVDARLIQADTLLAKKQTKKAVDILEGLNRSHPGAAGIKLQLARAYLQDDKPDQALAVLEQAVTANPTFADAVLLQAEINIKKGNAAQAITALEGILSKQANLDRAQILLADAYRAAGRLDDAAALFQRQIQQAPTIPKPYIFLGLVQRQQKKAAEARASFEKALQLAPGEMFALNQLVELDLEAKDYPKAMARVQEQLTKKPEAAESHLMEGKVFVAQKDWPKAEAALKKAIELDQDLGAAYELLVAIYLETGKSAQASQELEAVLAKSPQNTAALTILASVQEKQGDYAKAAATYQRVLAVDGNNTPALNNLAYIYSERLNQPDQALELARKARTAAPGNAAVADTLGWIQFKRGDYQRAVPLLEEASAKMTESPEVRFHLGMAHYMMGNADAARAAFQQAISASNEFASRGEAERRLKLLDQTADGSSALTAGQLEAMLKEHPQDLMARIRLAEAYQKQGAFDRAAAAYVEAFNQNKKLASVALELAKIYAGPLHDSQKALEYAKSARELAPSDPKAAGVLGRIAFEAGNFPWSYSLLQEASRQAEGDAVVLHDFAWAAYSLGKVDQARDLMEQTLAASPKAEVASDSKIFLALMTPKDSSTPGASRQEIEQKLKEDPAYVPALMAAAPLDVQAGQKPEAIKRYQEALRRFPAFAPAQKQLALLLVEDKARTDEAYDLAAKARKSLPDDPAVAQLLGQLSYEKKDYSRALQLLQESARKAPLNAEGLSFLGLSYKGAGQPEKARKTLAEALAAAPREPLRGEAERALGELKQK